MSDYITLMGSEDVSRAGHNMVAAGSDMNRAASSMSEAFHRHEQFLTDWLYEFREIVEGLKVPQGKEAGDDRK